MLLNKLVDVYVALVLLCARGLWMSRGARTHKRMCCKIIGARSSQQILDWCGTAMGVATATDDKAQGAKTFWTEWSQIEDRVAFDMRSKIVIVIDGKSSSCGFPSLRERVTH